MSTFIVVEVLYAKPGKKDDLKEALLKMVPLILQEKGCLAYEIAEAEEDAAFLVLMRWQQKENLDAHNNSAHIQDFVKKYDNVLYGKVEETHFFSCQ